MSTQITLKIKDEKGNIQKRQHESEDINLLQFEQMLEVVKDIFVQLQDNKSLKQLFIDFFNDNELSSEELEQAKDIRMIQSLISSFETLAFHMPQQAIRLISVLSGIEINILQQQKMLDVFDIYDAVIEENDLEKLWKRTKKSLAATKVKMSFIKITQKTKMNQTKQV